jgi:hypothetical protein
MTKGVRQTEERPMPMSSRSRRPATDAASAYAARRTEIAKLIEQLDAKLADHAVKQAAQPRHWGFVGDLDHVAELLRAAVGNEA